MVSLSKIASLALVPICAGLIGCTFPTRTGYDRNIGDYKPIAQASAEQANSSKKAPAQTGNHKTSAGDVKQAAAKKSIPEPPAPKTTFEEYASKWLGTPYVYGANSTKGTDCSGYVMQVYQGFFNIALPHNAHMMYKDERGKSVSRGSLREAECLPDILVDMNTVGEETGELEKTLNTIAGYYDSELEQATADALAKLEPAILCVLAVIAGFIVISMYMAMFTMYNSM